MKMRSLLLEAGSIIAWKKYSKTTRLWNWLNRKELPFNMFTIVSEKTELLTTESIKNMSIYEPVRRYSKLELGKAASIINAATYCSDWLEIATIVNLIRPNTLSGPTTIGTCKYYKEVNCNEKLDEYIY